MPRYQTCWNILEKLKPGFKHWRIKGLGTFYGFSSAPTSVKRTVKYSHMLACTLLLITYRNITGAVAAEDHTEDETNIRAARAAFNQAIRD